MAAITLITENVTNAAATLTRDALVGLGHTVTLLADSALGTTALNNPALVVGVRVTESDTVANYFRGIVDKGIPALLGLGLGITNDTNGDNYLTRMGLVTTLMRQTSATANEEVVTDNSHPITSAYTNGQRITMSSAVTLWQAVATGSTHVGQALTTGDPDTSLSGLVTTFAVPTGTTVQGRPTGAAMVVSGMVYGAANYTADGKTFLGSMVTWLLAQPRYRPNNAVGITLATNGVGQFGTVQEWVSPITGHVLFDARGAAGGTGYLSAGVWTPGGKGARVAVRVPVTTGDVFRIIVGQKGIDGIDSGRGGGGGGATWIYNVTAGTLVLVAGGGGGMGNYAAVASSDAVLTNDGLAGLRSVAGTGGVAGQGGNGSGSYNVGGGAGYLSDGKVKIGEGGKRPFSDFAHSGWGGTPFSPGAGGYHAGGFGGGGASYAGAGGGGGYSGGGAGGYSNAGQGGGGGSYANPAYQYLTSFSSAGANSGQGSVAVADATNPSAQPMAGTSTLQASGVMPWLHQMFYPAPDGSSAKGMYLPYTTYGFGGPNHTPGGAGSPAPGEPGGGEAGITQGGGVAKGTYYGPYTHILSAIGTQIVSYFDLLLPYPDDFEDDYDHHGEQFTDMQGVGERVFD